MESPMKSSDNRTRARARSSEVTPVTEGQRQLLALEVSRNEIAEGVGVSGPMVSQWRTGAKTPGADPRRRLEKAFRIPVWAWDRPPGFEAPQSTASPQERAAPRAEGGSETVVDLIAEQLEILRGIQRDPNLSTSEQARVSDSISKLVTLKFRADELEKEIRRDVEREYEDQAVKESTFVRALIDTVLESLWDHPEALRSLRAALDTLRSSDAA